jgi:3-hydroxyacyl-CoA dehydrogenase/enoyl-CoA hydratase/3-hydroxybutyryl-CoA epimerase/3-hydroxyacyl-CoA dehydrogenase/enoyl-CoA hydratase/3-hydroxybutyryl-CoA epimerase/enoyl-CoA isomerase
MNRNITTLEFLDAGIAVITLNDPQKGANILSRSVLEAFSAHLDAVDARQGVAGLVIRSTKPGNFIAGADLTEFSQSLDAPKDDIVALARRGQRLFRRLSQCNYVTVAAIDGICVGGGAEMASWCDRRILARDEKTSFGFPEVKLGILPGWGGTARLPRIVGLANAIEMITGGESIDADEAYKMGLAQDIVDVPPTEQQSGDVIDDDLRAARLLDAAVRMIGAEHETGSYRTDRKRWSGPIQISETELGFLGATASAYIQGQTEGHYPAPIAALEVMLEAAGTDVNAACDIEAGALSQLFGSPINRALLNVFFLRDRNKKDRGVEGAAGEDLQPRAIKSVSVIGAGIMGQGIAAANVKRRIPVALADAAEEALARGVQGVLEEVAYNKQTKKADAERAVEFSPFINATISDAEIARADLVVEAIIENADAKKRCLARLEPQLDRHAILCSNTSTIPITTLAADLAHPDRFCGLHFFNPVRRMPLVEVIRGEKTSDATVATAVAYAKRLGKSPIVVKDGPGFLVNRLLLPYMNESLEVLREGASIKEVEKAAKSFGMPMGPITLFDVVGLDTALHAGRVMYEAFPDRIVPSETLAALYKVGRLGQKTGKGFFAYKDKKGKGAPDPEVEAMLAERVREKRQWSTEQLQDRMFLPMILEATRILEEGLVRDARDVDLGLIFGVGFPPFKGGLLFWADTLGAKAIIERLKPFESLGRRYEPTKMLREMAESGRRFYEQ